MACAHCASCPEGSGCAEARHRAEEPLRSLDDLLLELADTHSGCRKDSSDIIARELARVSTIEVHRG
jgi:hypothetical protein